MPTDKPITLQEHAMRFGTFMGIFWIFKFIYVYPDHTGNASPRIGQVPVHLSGKRAAGD